MSGRSFFIWILSGLFVALAAVGLVIASRVPIAHLVIGHLAARAGIPIRAMTVAALGVDGMRIEDVSLGDESGPTVGAITVSWTPQSLANGRATNIVVRKPHISLDLSQETVAVDGLRIAPATSRSRPYFSTLDVADARVSARTQWGTVTIQGGGRLSYGADDMMSVSANITSAQMEVAGGQLAVSDVSFTMGQPLSTIVSVSNVMLEPLIALLEVDGLSGTGTLSGSIPIRWSGSDLSIADGKLSAHGPGTLRYSGDALPKEMPGADAQTMEQVALARTALSDFRYKSLAMELSRGESGDGAILLKLDGSNPAVMDDHPIAFNIRLETNFDKLAPLVMQGLDAADTLRNRGLKARGK